MLKQKSGVYELEVTDPGSDLVFTARTFSIKRGETVAVRAWFERKQTASAKASSPSNPTGQSKPTGAAEVSNDPDVKAAAWVLSIGGKINVLYDQKWREITTLKDYQGAQYEYASIELVNNSKVTDAGLENVKGFTKNVFLMLRSTTASADCLKHLQAMPNLKALEFSNHNETSIHKLGDVGAGYIRTMTGLESLVLGGEGLTDSQLEKLSTLTGLKELHIHYNEITDAGLARIKSFPNLRGLLLEANKITDNGLVHLKELTSLRGLHLGANSISDAGLKNLYGLKDLEWVDLTRTGVTAEAAAALHKAIPNCIIKWDGGAIEPVVTPAGKKPE